MTTKILVDPNTGTQYQVDIPEETGTDGDGQTAPQTPEIPAGAGGGSIFHRNTQAIEKQLEVFLTNTDKPDTLKKTFWALGTTLALTKITDPMAHFRLKLGLENVLRAPYLSNDEKADTDILTMDLLDFDAKLNMSRSVAYDDHPTERELWVMFQNVMKQHIEQTPIQAQSSGSILGSIANRLLGRGRR